MLTPWTTCRAPVRAATTAPASSPVSEIDDVRPPFRGAGEQVGDAVVGGLHEQPVGHAGDPLLEAEPVEVGVRGAEAGVHVGAAAPDLPHRQPVPSYVVGQFGAGRHHDVVARPLGGPRQRQHRVDVPEGGFRGHQDAHATHGPRAHAAGKSVMVTDVCPGARA